MTNDEEAEIRAYVAELEASIRAAELRLARTDSVLDEAREEAAQWKRLAEQTTDARLAEAIASREVMQRERDEARRELLDLDLVLPAACGSRVDAARQLEAERDEARAQLAALHAAASAVQAKARALPVSMTEIVHAEEWDDLDRVLADLATAAGEHDARVRAPVEAERDQLAAALAEVRDAASESIRESFWVGNDAPARAARETVAAVEKRLENNRALLEHESVIRSSHARADELRASVRTLEQAYEAAMQVNVDAGSALRRALATVVDYERRVAASVALHAAAAARFDRHQAALAAVPAREAALAESLAADEAHEAALGALSQLRDAQAGRSAFGLVQEYLNAEDAAAEHRVVETRARAARARTALAEARRACEGLDEHASTEYAAACERLDDLRGELRAARDAHEARGDAAAETGTRLTEASLAVRDARATLLAAETALRAWPGDVLVRLDQARARVEELEAQLGPARAAREELQSEAAGEEVAS